jgi:hypothetical protein
MTSTQAVQITRMVERITLAIGSSRGWSDVTVVMNALGSVVGEMAALDTDRRKSLAVATTAAESVIDADLSEGAVRTSSPAIQNSAGARHEIPAESAAI